MPPINATQTRCHGCNKGFTHYGLSRHIRSTQNLRCRAVYSVPQASPGFRSIPDVSGLSAASSQTSLVASIPNPALRANPEEASNNHLVNNGADEYLTAQSSGEFSMAHVMDRVRQMIIVLKEHLMNLPSNQSASRPENLGSLLLTTFHLVCLVPQLTVQATTLP